MLDAHPVDTGRKLNVHKTFRRRPGRLLNVLCTFNLRPVSTGHIKKEQIEKIKLKIKSVTLRTIETEIEFVKYTCAQAK